MEAKPKKSLPETSAAPTHEETALQEDWVTQLDSLPGASRPNPAPPETTFFSDTLPDMAKGAVSSIFKSTENTAEGVVALADGVTEFFGGDLVDDNFNLDWVPDDLKPKTGAGETTQSILSFVLGWTTFGNKLKALNWGGKAVKAFGAGVKAQAFANAALAGGAIDYFIDGNTENRLANVLVEHDILRNPLIDWLAAKKDDSLLEARLKNVVEGFVQGAAIDLTMSSFHWLKKIINTKDPLKKAAMRAAASEDLTNQAVKAKQAEQAAAEGAAQAAEGTAKATGSAAKETAKDTVKTVYTETGKPRINPNTLNPEAGKWAIDLDTPIRQAMDDVHIPEGVTNVKAHTVVDEFVEEYGASNLLDFTGKAKDAASEAGMSLIENMKKIAYVVQEQLIPATDATMQLWRADPTNPKLREQAIASLARLAEGFANLGDAKSWTGRALVSNKATAKYAIGAAGEVLLNPDQILNARGLMDVLTQNFSDEALMELHLGMTTLAKGGHSTASVGKFLISQLKDLSGQPRSAFQVFSDNLKYYWYNSVLSGPKTHLANAAGNYINIYGVHQADIINSSIAESVLAGNGFLDGFNTGLNRTKAYREGVNEAWHMAKESVIAAWQTGNSVLDITTKLDHAKTIMKKGPTSLLDRIISAPSRALAASDEAFKQMAYRGELSVKFFDYIKKDPAVIDLLKGAKKAGTETYEKTLKALRDDFFKNQYGAAAVGIDRIIQNGRALNKEALAAAQELTWQSPLPKAARHIQQALQNIPGGFLLVPFVKTPTNLAKEALWTHSPLGILRLYGAASDPALKAKIWGQFATSSMLWGLSYALYQNGFITGSGPADKEARDALRESGWQPNALKLGKYYININQLEPIAAPLTLIASYFERMSDVDPMNPQESQSYIASAFNAIGAYATDKTFLKGIADVVQAIQGDEGKFKYLLKSQATSWIPSLVNNLNQAISPDTREATDILSAMQNRVPGLSNSLPTRYSWLTGKPIVYPHGGGLGPFFPSVSSKEGNIVFDTLAKTHRAMNRPSRSVIGLPMDDAQYSEYCKLHGSLRLGGKTLYQRLEQLFNSPRFKNAAPDLSETSLSAQREEMIKDIVERYRAAATTKYHRLHPEVVVQLRDLRRQEQALKQGRPLQALTSF